DELLGIVDWVVDAETKQTMSLGDWLMIVLGVYFHDMGMLVTQEEYKNRDKSAFPKFKDDTFTGPDSSPDYVARIREMPPDEMERFLYQEFVRKTHAIRVRRWIEGNRDAEHGYTLAAVDEVQRVLGSLDPVFKKDLALIAESHHLDDLDDLRKYNP